MGRFELIMHQADIGHMDYIQLKEMFENEDALDFRIIADLLGEKKSQSIRIEKEKLDDTIEKLKSLEIQTLDVTDENFPKFLTQIPNPCYLLYCKGDTHLLNQFSVGIIGSRKPTQYGKYVANTFSSELARRGAIIVSGFALGIDSESHKAATKCKGKTIGVLGTSLDNIYPKSNKEYAKEILKTGNLIISEFKPGTTTLPYHFVQRNRLISAIAEGLLIVEASEKSGTLTTVDHALEQGKPVFAVPGNINSRNSYGTNKLIKLGAKPVTEVEDILEEYPFFKPHVELKEEIGLSNDEAAVIKIIREKGMVTSEEIAFFTNINIKYIIGILSVMEIKGIVKDLGNNSYMLI